MMKIMDVSPVWGWRVRAGSTNVVTIYALFFQTWNPSNIVIKLH